MITPRPTAARPPPELMDSTIPMTRKQLNTRYDAVAWTATPVSASWRPAPARWSNRILSAVDVAPPAGNTRLAPRPVRSILSSVKKRMVPRGNICAVIRL